MSNNIKKLVNEDSPWHNEANKDWFVKDGALRELIEAENQGLFHPPKINFILEKDLFKELINNPNKFGIVIIRGPRRIGKTSTLKYLVKKLIDGGIRPSSFIYISLDKDELFIKDEKKRFLREMIKDIIKEYKKPNQPLFVILDEVTFYEGWARALKNLIDEGEIGPEICIIATGSYSLDLSSAKRELAGRFGPLGEKFNGDIFFYPRKFIEIAESLLGENFKKFIAKNFGLFGKRVGMIEYLAGAQSETNNIKFNYEKLLKQILEDHYESLHDLFENIYLYAGGYPKSFYEATTSKRNKGVVEISDARYREDIYDLLVTDSKKFGLSEEVLKNILQKINFPSMQIKGDYSTLTQIKKEEVNRYISYLRASGLIEFIPHIDSPKQIDLKNLLVETNKNQLKLIVTDPSAFIAAYSCSRGISLRILEQIKSILDKNKEIKELLFESIAISHLLRSPVTKKKFLIDNVGYILFQGKELVDAVAWYVNWKNELILIPIEVKSGNINMGEIRDKLMVLKEAFDIKRLIVICNEKRIEIKQDYVILPIEIFLLFL